MVRYTYPGVYVEEVSFRSRSIDGVDTSTAAFVGGTRRGPTDRPSLVASFSEFERRFGALASNFPLGYAVRQFFENGGRRARICRVRGARRGASPTDDAISDPALESQRKGLWLLDRAKEVPAIIVIPPLGPGRDVGRQTWDAAAGYAKRHRAMLIVDAPEAWRGATDPTDGAVDAIVQPTTDRTNVALYYPRIVAPDPSDGNRPRTFAASGAVAGVWARTDMNAGVWTPPAGTSATLLGTTGLTTTLTRTEGDDLNRRGINTLRTFAGQGQVVWGARTLAGSDAGASDWKYVPIRRLALFIERSVEKGTAWAVFEPNDEPLWIRLRGDIENFLTTLFHQGALKGRKPEEAFFVRCDRSTTTQADIDNGRVNILVGFAATKPAEFVTIRIEQRAGTRA